MDFMIQCENIKHMFFYKGNDDTAFAVYELRY